MPKPNPPRHHDYAVIIGALLVLLFASPVMRMWTTDPTSWYLPYLLWGFVVLLALLILLRKDNDEP